MAPLQLLQLRAWQFLAAASVNGAHGTGSGGSALLCLPSSSEHDLLWRSLVFFF
jgi:hypothetical protein